MGCIHLYDAIEVLNHPLPDLLPLALRQPWAASVFINDGDRPMLAVRAIAQTLLNVVVKRRFRDLELTGQAADGLPLQMQEANSI